VNEADLIRLKTPEGGLRAMASGVFPLPRNSAPGQKLLQAAALIEEVVMDAWEWSRDDNEFDNAAADGASRALLSLAARLVREEVETE
jgi:hypothetical protein